MAASTLPKPGTKHGPCVDICEHRDCASLRRDAGSPCTVCHRGIGFATPFYRDGERLAHAACLEDSESFVARDDLPVVSREDAAKLGKELAALDWNGGYRVLPSRETTEGVVYPHLKARHGVCDRQHVSVVIATDAYLNKFYALQLSNIKKAKV